MEKSYLMLSLDDEKAKDLADVMGNKTCKRILSLLAEREISESDIAKELNQPMNTIEYNLKKLVSAGLVEKSKAFFWSVKGKKIPMYRLANKYIVIMPKSKIALKVFLPVIAVIGLAAAGINYLSNKTIQSGQLPNFKFADQAGEMLYAATPSTQRVAEISNAGFLNWFLTTPWAIFIAGSIVAIGAYFLTKNILKILKGGLK